MNKVDYNGARVTNATGGKRVCRWAPIRGYDLFAVFVYVRLWAANQLEPIHFPDNVPGRYQGDLTISEGDMTTSSFPGIDLIRMKNTITQRYKERALHFQYDRTVINAAIGPAAPTFGFTEFAGPASGSLKDNYTVKINGNPENVIAAEAVTNDTTSTVVRLVTVRTGTANSALEAMKVMHTTHNATRGLFAPVAIDFSRAQLILNPTSLAMWEVIELYGTALDEPLPAVEGYSIDGPPESLFSGKVTGLSLLEHHRDSRGSDDNLPFGAPLQCVTIQFQPNFHRDLDLV